MRGLWALTVLLLLAVSPATATETCPKGFAPSRDGKVCVPAGIAPQCMTCMPAMCRCLYKADTCAAEPEAMICEAAHDRCPAAAAPERICPVPGHRRHHQR